MENEKKSDCLITLCVKISNLELEELEAIASRKGLSLAAYVEENVKKDIHYVFLDDGFKVSKKNDCLYDCNNNLVDLAKKEAEVFASLYKKRNEILSINDLRITNWNNDENTSVYSIRNVIRKIRQKTCHGVIRSHSKKGYSIGSFKEI